MLKLIILKHRPQTYLLGKVQEMDEEPSLLIDECYEITPEGELAEYPLHTTQRYIFLTGDDVLTMMDPSPVIAKKHKTLVNE